MLRGILRICRHVRHVPRELLHVRRAYCKRVHQLRNWHTILQSAPLLWGVPRFMYTNREIRQLKQRMRCVRYELWHLQRARKQSVP